MKRVKILMDCSLASLGSVKAGAVLDLDDDQAKELIEMNAAEKTKEPTAQEAKAAASAAAGPAA